MPEIWRSLALKQFCFLHKKGPCERPVKDVSSRDEGWTPETAADVFEGSIKHDLVGLVSAIDYFSYEPFV